MRANFVTFYSPGTFVAEQTTKPVDGWDVDTAIEMSRSIKERYGAVPYGFQFSTRARSDGDLDSKEIERSPMYYLGGRVETVEEVAARNDPKERILLQNMRCNGWNSIIINENSWRWTQPLNDGDVVLERP